MEKLFSKMGHIVHKHVKHYKEDFDADKESICQMMDEKDDTPYERYLYWIVRRCGTNIGYKSNVHHSPTFSYYLDENVRYYELDLKKQTVTYIKDPYAYKKTCA